jgi:hypothetical protein
LWGQGQNSILQQFANKDGQFLNSFWDGRLGQLAFDLRGARVSSPAAASPDLTAWDFLDADWIVHALRLAERELCQLAADGGRLMREITGRLVCADALRLGTSRAPAKALARRTMLGDDGNQNWGALRTPHSTFERLVSGIQFGMDNWRKWGRIHAP